MGPKVVEVLGIQDAMENLAAVAMINMESPPPIGIVKKNRIVTDEEEFGPGLTEWLSAEGTDGILALLDKTYRSIHSHLLSLYENPETDWESEKSRKGVSSMMALVGESARKMNAYLQFRTGKNNFQRIEEREEFKGLQRFYVDRFAKKFAGGLEGEEAWEAEWNENEEASFLDTAGSGLKDFETIRRDREYELFYIRNELGKPYFTPELLKNIKLTVQFDSEQESFEEDPLLKVRAMLDRDLHATASQVLAYCHPLIEDFYKILKKDVESDLGEALSMAITALFLSANPRNLIQNTAGKSSLQYFEDFHRFLRRALKTVHYQKLIAYSPDPSDRAAQVFLKLTHQLCRALVCRFGGVKQEAIGLIHRTMRRGDELQLKRGKGETIWNQFLLDDEKFRTLLGKFPSGPLFKVLDLIRSEEDEDAAIPFDPIGQGNLPSTLFEIHFRGKKGVVLRLPCPTRQQVINKVEVIDEWRGFLRTMIDGSKEKKVLILNFQDRTSWREHARCRALESLQQNAEFSSHLLVMTLPKDTDFYYQNNEYLQLGDADLFLKTFKEQLMNSEDCGFFFPLQWKKEEIYRFADRILPQIHEQFFHGKNTLTRKNRQDFIEIFYQFLILRAIDHFSPDCIAFSCKDGVDTAPAAAALFYGLVQLLSSDFSSSESKDLFRWILYTPALFVRERAVDPERFHRSLAALERLDGEISDHKSQILKAFEENFQPKSLRSYSLKNASF